MNIQELVDYCVNSSLEIAMGYEQDLDFSDESIEIVDKILDDYHDRYINPENDKSLIKEHINQFAHIFGIYVGEVLKRNYAQDCAWKETENGVVLMKDEKNHMNPIAKAYKQIADGKEAGDDIRSFFDIAIMFLQNKFPL
jgi:DNA-directed RNA polymerase subunit K/omega